MKIITGKTLTTHVNSEDDRGLHAGTFGTGSYVLDVGTKFKATIESSNTIRIDSGDLVHNGCHARIPHDEYDEVTIDSCSPGCQRIDLIVARYRKQAGIESVELEVIKGAEAISDPVQPDYETGSILGGANISDMPLYKVNLSNPGSSTSVTLSTLFSVMSVMEDMYNKSQIDDLLNKINKKIYPVGSIYISVNDVDPTTLFGGTWQRIKDRFLLSAGDTYENGTTGGEARHTLTTDEMPEHYHETKEFITGEWVTKGSSTDTKVISGVDTSNVGSTSAGKGKAHNNMPPYLVVNVWKRVG